MSYNITGTTITLTRGDTFEALVSATKRDGTQYIPVEGDSIRFAMKENYDDPRPLLVKDIPIDTMIWNKIIFATAFWRCCDHKMFSRRHR